MEIVCPSGLSGRVRKMKVHEARALSDRGAADSARMLESMGLAGKWQKCGTVEVSIQNSGPKGAETSIILKAKTTDFEAMEKPLQAVGIDPSR